MRVLVFNAGSSSLKIRALDEHDQLLADHELTASRGHFDEDDVAKAIQAMPPMDAVGHRVVHGGPRYKTAVRLDDAVVEYLDSLTDLAPLHQPAALAGIELAGRLLPQLPAVAAFDTAFHANMPAAAATYAIPAEWRERWGIKRYGFHGLSHAYCARRAAELLGRAGRGLRVVTCHLGAGASLAAVSNGRSIATTMGFTPLEGLVMATRSGDLDPGALLYLERHANLTESQLFDALEHRSGLVALAGTADMQQVLERLAAGEERARLAFDVYIQRLVKAMAAMAAAMGGLDAVVFTGGVGENAAPVREAAAAALAFIGVGVDRERNAGASPDLDISSGGALVRTLVVRAREDIEVAREVRAALERP